MKIKLIIIFSCLSVVLLYFILKDTGIKTSKEIDFNNTRGYNEKNLNRYYNYQKQYNLSLQDTVTRVNIGLDYPFYTNTIEIKEVNYTTLVNKYLKLPNNYVPNDLEIVKTNNPNKLKLRKDAAAQLEKMIKDMEKENLHIILESAYRSYSYQVFLYNKYKDKDGITIADTYSARPGYSEHQLGLSFDLRTKEFSYENFEKSREFIWMNENAYKYGFILRYPKNKENITGYNYEPWHYRYVGKIISTNMNNHKNLSFDEYYYLYIKKK